jgi:hypothetical protein
VDSENELPLRDASRRLREIAREHLRRSAAAPDERQATPRVVEESRAVVAQQMTAGMKARSAREARIRQRVDAILGRASAKMLGDLDGALSLFERRLDAEGQTDAR